MELINRFLKVIGYPQSLPEPEYPGAPALLRIDDEAVEAWEIPATAGMAAALRLVALLKPFPDEDDAGASRRMERMLEAALPRTLKSPAVLGYDPTRKRAILWIEIVPPEEDGELLRAAENFFGEVDWWNGWMEEEPQPMESTASQLLFFRP